MRQLLVSSATLTLMVLAQSSAFAQSAEPNTSVTQVSSSNQEREDDLVVLKNGSRFRGKIIEAIAGDHISIEVAPGAMRQVSMAEVTYAGPLKLGPPMTAITLNPAAPVSPTPVADVAADPVAPVSPTPPAPVTAVATELSAKPGEALVNFQTKTPGLIVWVAAESPLSKQVSGFKRLCEAPCRYPLQLGNYKIAYSIGSDKPLEAKNLVRIAKDSTIETEIVSHRVGRTIGWVILGLGAATGTVLVSTAAGFHQGDPRRKKYATNGVLSVAGGVMIGLSLGLMSDTAVVVELAPPTQGKNPTASPQASYNGLSFVGRF
jgi:hypothetical protein